jgi:hypothetical protein
MNIINIDEHHDFYGLKWVNFDSCDAEIGCWNFFAFMAHKNLMSKYTWITNCETVKATVVECRDLMSNLRRAKSNRVRIFKNSMNVVRASQLMDVVSNKKFDGVILVRSPEYTERRRSVYYAVDRALEKFFPKVKVRRYGCRTNFRHGLARRRANNLFQRV